MASLVERRFPVTEDMHWLQSAPGCPPLTEATIIIVQVVEKKPSPEIWAETEIQSAMIDSDLAICGWDVPVNLLPLISDSLEGML